MSTDDAASHGTVCSAETLTMRRVKELMARHPNLTFPCLETLTLDEHGRWEPELNAPHLRTVVCAASGASVTAYWVSEMAPRLYPELNRVQIDVPDNTSSALVPCKTDAETKRWGESAITLQQLLRIPPQLSGLSFYIPTPEAAHVVMDWMSSTHGPNMSDAPHGRHGYLIVEFYDDVASDDASKEVFATSRNASLTDRGMSWIGSILTRYQGAFETISVNTIGTLLDSPEDDEAYFGPILQDIEVSHAVLRGETRLILAMGGGSKTLAARIEALNRFRRLTRETTPGENIVWVDWSLDQGVDDPFPQWQYVGRV